MNAFVELMNLVFSLVKYEFVIDGFTFSVWQVIVLVCLASIIGKMISGLFS